MNLEPFYQLAVHPQIAIDSLLITKSSTPLTAIYPSLRNGRFFLALVATSGFLAEALIICLSNIHFKNTTTFEAFTISIWLATSILVVMIITLILIAFRRQPKLSLEPDTIAATLCLLADSTILERFDGLGLVILSTKQRDEMISGLGLRYALYRTNAEDGNTRIVVDVEH